MLIINLKWFNLEIINIIIKWFKIIIFHIEIIIKELEWYNRWYIKWDNEICILLNRISNIWNE